MSRIKSIFLKNGIDILFGVLQSVSYVAVCFVVFPLTGFVLVPLAVAIFAAAIFTLAFSLNRKAKKGISSCGIAQLLTVCFFVIFAIVKELQINAAAGWAPYWIEYFYFDKFLMLGSVWLSSSAVIAISHLFVRGKEDAYKLFFKFSSVAFVIFYAALLIYSFVLIRLKTAEYPLNLVPFSTIKGYIADWQTIPYEVFMMFFGNLLYFAPMGYIFYVALRHGKFWKRLSIIAVFPLIAFSLLELSQYVFQNGFCEIDDMMMNTLGFWLGVALAPISDILTSRATKKRLNHFWC